MRTRNAFLLLFLVAIAVAFVWLWTGKSRATALFQSTSLSQTTLSRNTVGRAVLQYSGFPVAAATSDEAFRGNVMYLWPRYAQFLAVRCIDRAPTGSLSEVFECLGQPTGSITNGSVFDLVSDQSLHVVRNAEVGFGVPLPTYLEDMQELPMRQSERERARREGWQRSWYQADVERPDPSEIFYLYDWNDLYGDEWFNAIRPCLVIAGVDGKAASAFVIWIGEP